MKDIVQAQLSTASLGPRMIRFFGIVLTQIVVFQHLPGWDGAAWLAPADMAFEWIKVCAPAVIGLYTGPDPK